MRKHNDELLQSLALHIVAGGKVTAWAAEHKISPRTAYHWCKQPGFKALVRGSTAEIMERIFQRFLAGADQAVKTINELAARAESERVKLMAARAVIQDMLSVRTVAAVEERLNFIDARLAAIEPPKDAA